MRAAWQKQCSAADLRARLTRLRESADYLRLLADLGRDMRLLLEEAGSPTWAPCEDLTWESWIKRHGDDYARAYLADLMAEAQAGEPTAAPHGAEQCTDNDGRAST